MAPLMLEALEPRTLLTALPGNFGMPGSGGGVIVAATPTSDSGLVEVFNAATISGWAFSPANNAAPVNVVITIDGVPTTILANGERPDLATKLGSTNHGFSFSVPGLATGTHSVTVDLIDPVTSAPMRLKTSTITIAPPSGLVETFNSTTISGWAFSAANNSAPINVVITVDGVATTISANISRSDMLTRFGSANHGFSYTVPGLATGTHSVTVDIIDPSTSTATRIRTGSIVIAAPTGLVEVLNNYTISGYAFSAANQAAPVSVVITIDGVATTVTANDNRPDLVRLYGSANHGFSYSTPALTTGTHTVTIDVLDPSGGPSKRLRTGTIVIAPPTGLVEVLNSNTISGYAFSAANNAAPASVIITIDGVPTTITAGGNRPDVVRLYGSANHGFSYTVPGLATGTHTVTVDVVDPSGGKSTRIRTGSLYIAPATGVVEVLNSTTISGYAFSAANNNAIVNVIITIDGVPTTVQASGVRADLLKRFGSSTVGFSYTVPSLATGTHSVTVDIVDPSTSAVTRIRTGSIVIAAPTGTAAIGKTAITGYAFSAANQAAPVSVIITINGRPVTILANGSRPDLVRTLGSANHGFTYALPALPTGANPVTIDIVDASTGLLKRILTSTITIGPPAGLVTTFNTTTISGWALNPADGAAPVNVVITINGNATTIAASQYIDSLVATYGSGYHGFSFSVPALPPGNSTVTVDLVDPYTGQTLRLRSGILTNSPPTGAVNISTANEIAGYATDVGMTGPLQVRIDVNGVAGTPFTANSSRKVINGMNVGFDVADDFAGKVVEVYAYDSQSNTPVLIWTNNHPPKGAVTSASGTMIAGWAVDPDDVTTPVNVQVFIDGQLLTTTLANLARPDVQATAGALNVGFSVTITGLRPGTHTITVYAVDGQANSQKPVLIGTKTVTDAPPIGKVETLNTSVVSGYALDPDLGANPATVNVYVDEELFATVLANGSDTLKPGHGFSVDLSSVPSGSHAITVTVMDDRVSDQQEVVFFDDFLNNHQPIGALESVTGMTITGWAQDPDAPTSPAAVDIYVDGQFVETVTANVDRPDLAGTLGQGNTQHGFSLDLPVLSFGTHKIDAYAAESQGNVSELIGTKIVTNNRPIGALESLTATTVTGWADDPDRPGDWVAIRVYVNGVQVTSGVANVDRPDLLTTLGTTQHGFSISVSLQAGVNKVDVYGVDNNNGLISLIGSQTITI